jgi:hypothetical protein
MTLGLWNIEWLNQNMSRAYPLVDWATRQDTAGAITLPDDFLVGFYFPISAGVNVAPERFFLKELGVYSLGYTLGIGYDDGVAPPALAATVSIARSTHTENRSYAVAGTGNFDDCIGTIVIGRLDNIDQLPPGQYTFDLDGAGFEVDCIRPMIRGISSLTVRTGQTSGTRLYGDIVLSAGENMRITASGTGGSSTITFSAIDGEGLTDSCTCEDTENTPPCIRTINGIPPTADGNFRLLGDDCLTLSAITNGLQFADTCSKPCCGCEELNAILQQLDRFTDGAKTLQLFVNRLSGEVTQMSQVVLGSRLGDTGGCIECGAEEGSL